MINFNILALWGERSAGKRIRLLLLMAANLLPFQDPPDHHHHHSHHHHQHHHHHHHHHHQPQHHHNYSHHHHNHYHRQHNNHVTQHKKSPVLFRIWDNSYQVMDLFVCLSNWFVHTWLSLSVCTQIMSSTILNEMRLKIAKCNKSSFGVFHFNREVSKNCFFWS